MIICDCGKRHTDMTGFEDVKNIGLTLYGTCNKCGLRQAVNTLWRRTKVIKWTGNVPREKKPRKTHVKSLPN